MFIAALRALPNVPLILSVVEAQPWAVRYQGLDARSLSRHFSRRAGYSGREVVGLNERLSFWIDERS
jgi:hypothetical protein